MNKKQILNFLYGNPMFIRIERHISEAVKPFFDELCRPIRLRLARTKRVTKKVSPKKKSSPKRVISSKKSSLKKGAKSKRIKPSTTELLHKSSQTSVSNSSL